VHGASATAREKVEAAGGTLTLLKEPKVKKARKRRTAPIAEPEPEAPEEAAEPEAAEPEAAADAEPESEV
jgi:hypothetical protein